MTPRGLPREKAAEHVGCKPRLFDYMVDAGEMPQPRLLRSKKVWDIRELDRAFERLPRANADAQTAPPPGRDDGDEWADDDDCHQTP